MGKATNLEAVVLRRFDSGESDRRLVLLGRGAGLVSAVAKGARKPGSRLAAFTEPLAYAQFHLAEGKATRFITQAERRGASAAWRRDYDRLTAGLALAELAAVVAQPEREDDDLLDLLLTAGAALAEAGNPPMVLAWFAVRALAVEGIAPSWAACPATGEPLRENPSWFSPGWGGCVPADAEPWPMDAYPVRAEALIGLARLAEREEPPPRMKFLAEALRALGPVWLGVAGRRLPAWDAAAAAFEQTRRTDADPPDGPV